MTSTPVPTGADLSSPETEPADDSTHVGLGRLARWLDAVSAAHTAGVPF